MEKQTRIDMRRNALYMELEDYWNVTRARRIKINMELDRLANEGATDVSVGVGS
jgi:hypothetical protein